MDRKQLEILITSIIDEVEQLIPLYMKNEEDSKKAKGGIAICIIDNEQRIYGKMFGEDRIMARERFRVAWLKASQVWITGIRTGEFEKRAFNNEIDEEQFGIRRPDYIGWEGGQPIHLNDETMLAAGFSGFRSSTDLEIVVKAFEKVYKNSENRI